MSHRVSGRGWRGLCLLATGQLLYTCRAEEGGVGHLGSIQSNVETPCPVQLGTQLGDCTCLVEHVVQATSGAELGHHARGIQAEAHEQDHIRVPDCNHDAHLQHSSHVGCRSSAHQMSQPEIDKPGHACNVLKQQLAVQCSKQFHVKFWLHMNCSPCRQRLGFAIAWQALTSRILHTLI